ncbi:FtsX-like permease family protein [Streptomyces sp. TRM 70361]|uniref:ABC transporter permease n=1 Tax=Streptomyces sp. TRM 70361 TaxID=3116553 RepID=UPI002E7C1E5F|nr:FtsX-like permease family protein [Streptomyces sp. TRM 70361]MEE1939691.1 FtsX-like permease family protein [Streptomyces sp. TRM 70361]
MFALAVRSVRKRPGRFFATLLATSLGATLIMTFGSLRDTADAAAVGAGAETLGTVGTMVGGYGALLVFFSVASTLTVNVRQRAAELALLRSIGATPGQIRRMVVGEAAVLALAGVLAAVVPAVFGGRLLLEMFKDSGQVAQGVDHALGPVALLSGIGVTLLASVGAAFLAVRRATREAAGKRGRSGRVRTVVGCLIVAAGTAGVLATFGMDAEEPALMAAPGYGAIVLSVGFALLSPVLLRGLLAMAGRPVAALTGASGQLAVHNMRKGAERLSGVLMPMTIFVGLATATLYMRAIQNDVLTPSGVTVTAEDENMETLNTMLVGIIVVFACLMLINSLYAATTHRRSEFGRQRLAGATPGQVMGMVGVETLVLTVTGVFLGTAAGLAGVTAFNSVLTDSTLPTAQGPGIWLVIVAVAAVATLVTGLSTARRTLGVPAVRAAAVAA